MSNEQLVLDPDFLATDPGDNGDPQSFPLEGVFMRASAHYRESHPRIEDQSNEANARVIVNLKGTLGQRNIVFPYMNDWFINYSRNFRLKAVGVSAHHHSQTELNGYYWNECDGGTVYTLKRKVSQEDTMDGGRSDRTLNDWAQHRVPDGVVWIDSDIDLVESS